MRDDETGLTDRDIAARDAGIVIGRWLTLTDLQNLIERIDSNAIATAERLIGEPGEDQDQLPVMQGRLEVTQQLRKWVIQGLEEVDTERQLRTG